MFLEVPITRYNETKDKDEEILIDLNPTHIISIEQHETRKNKCVVWLVSDLTLEVNLHRVKLKERISDFLRESAVLDLYRKDRRIEGN